MCFYLHSIATDPTLMTLDQVSFDFDLLFINLGTQPANHPNLDDQ